MVHDSGSIQYADQERPRVILFGDGLMLALAEDPRSSQRTVEIIALNESTWKFTFDELRFDTHSSELLQAPTHCQSCHGTTQKPLWEPYDFWPNIYGSSIARFGSAAEKAGYERLRKSPNKIGIYKRLQWYPPPTNSNSGLAGIEAFTEYVTQLQLMVSLQSWKEKGPRVVPFFPALLAIWSGCTTGSDANSSAILLESYLPNSWQRRIQQELPKILASSEAQRNRFKLYQEQRYRILFPQAARTFPMDHQRLADETVTAAQTKIVLREMGLDLADIALSQGANPFLLSVPSNSDADFATNLVLVEPKLFDELQPDLRTVNDYGLSWARFNCQSLKTKSLQSLAMLTPSNLAISSRSAPTVFGECISCHVLDKASTGAPDIAFDRTAALRTYLQSNNNSGLQKITDRINRTGQGQMPPQRSLSFEEKTRFMVNLRSLLPTQNP